MEQDFRIKYRPRKFTQMVGQNGNLAVLQRKLSRKRLKPGFAICGGIGTGKTTLARIIGRSINCDNPDSKNSDPCDVCDTCVHSNEVLYSELYNEIDGTTFHQKEYEELRDRITYSVGNKCRVVYIDEFQKIPEPMQHCFLKLVEDEHLWQVVFIISYATDDGYKVIQPLLQRLHVTKLIPPIIKDIVPWLKGICEKEGLHAEDKALSLVAEYSQRNPRRCLASMENLAVMGQPITLEFARQVLDGTREEM